MRREVYSETILVFPDSGELSTDRRVASGNILTLPGPIVNPDLHENTFAWWIARSMAGYAVDNGVGAARAGDWLSALDAAERNGEFFFSSAPILTTAIAA